MKKLIGVVVASIMLSGCAKFATKQDIKNLEGDMNEIRAAILTVAHQSNDAQDAAKEALSRIDTLTEVTATCCAENRSRLDALFEHAMQK